MALDINHSSLVVVATPRCPGEGRTVGMGALHPQHLTGAPMATVPWPRSTPASCGSCLAAWQLGEAAALPEPSQVALRGMAAPQGSTVPRTFIVSHASPEGTPLFQPPSEHLKREGQDVHARVGRTLPEASYCHFEGVGDEMAPRMSWRPGESPAPQAGGLGIVGGISLPWGGQPSSTTGLHCP